MIEIGNLSDFEICAFEAKACAHEHDMILEDEAILLIATASNGDFRKTRRLIRWICDYMLVNDEQFDIIPADYAQRAIKLHEI